MPYPLPNDVGGNFFQLEVYRLLSSQYQETPESVWVEFAFSCFPRTMSGTSELTYG
jgi:hypothetical protein